MALIRCPECGREISQYADKCPGCGWPVPKPTAREGNYSECSNYEDSYEEYLRQRRQAQRDSAANGAADKDAVGIHRSKPAAKDAAMNNAETTISRENVLKRNPDVPAFPRPGCPAPAGKKSSTRPKRKEAAQGQ